MYILLLICLIFIATLGTIILYQQDKIEKLECELFIVNDAIDKLYEEVFPDDY